MITASLFTTVTTCLLVVWLLIPKATLPLTNKHIAYLESGTRMERVWPKLSKKERQHWQQLADQLKHTQS